MRNRLVLLILTFCIVGSLHAVDPEWGIKYGMGFSTIFGSDGKYNLHYDLASVTNDVEAYYGYLDMQSQAAHPGTSYQIGAYYARHLREGKDALWVQGEIFWQRYRYLYNFASSPTTDNVSLAAAFADSLNGSIEQSIDYVTIPLLLKFRQSLDGETYENYQGAFVYFGPSFSLAIQSTANHQQGIKALDKAIKQLVADSHTDSNSNSHLTIARRNSAADKILVHKTDLILGAGFHLKDILQLGFGKDEYVIDCRFTGSLYNLGDASTKPDFKLQSLMISLGVGL